MRASSPEPWSVAVVPGGLIATGALLACVLWRYPAGGWWEARPVIAAVFAGFVGLALLVAWADSRRSGPAPGRRDGIAAGLVTGGLWVAEIAFNNISRSSAATRLWLDDSVWAAIALILLVVAFRAARRGSFGAGLSAGVWSGTVSGVIACLAALSLVVFFMPALRADPLNIAEYAARVPNGIPSIATYFAYETVTGALGHLIVLGTLMGLLLGLIGGAAGTADRRLTRRSD